MSWPTPKYTRTQVKKAGVYLVDHASEQFGNDDEANKRWLYSYEVLSNWRAAHAYPVNTFQATLRGKLKRIDANGFAVQRLKRLPSIVNKLERPDRTKLHQMQDIGGLRAVLSDMYALRSLVGNYKNTKFEHVLKREDDYVGSPKKSGYRSHHLVYKYNSKGERASLYNGMLVELQFRTRLQHEWATAVETMGILLKQSLKSSEGEEHWLEFFAAVSSAFAHIEQTPLVPGFDGLDADGTSKYIQKLIRSEKLITKMMGLTQAANMISSDAVFLHYNLIVLDLDSNTVGVETFGRDRLDEAATAYSTVELKIAEGANMQAVLVSSQSLDQLKIAYPNYFLDIDGFVRSLKDIL